jgi:hypothetical protein
VNTALKTIWVLAGFLTTAVGITAFSQAMPGAPTVTATPPPTAGLPASAGLANDLLREQNSAFTNWDFGGAVRGRFEVKDGYGIPGVPGSVDFRNHGADVDNEYFLERIRFRGGYTDKWWNALVEGESSLAQSDQRWAYANNPAVPGTVAKQGDGPEADGIELHQAIVGMGNLKEFPLSLKVGRMEMSYGDERLIGAFGWNNIGRTFDAAKVRWQNEWFGVDLFASRPVVPQNGVFDVPNAYDFFSGFYATSLKLPKNILDVYLLARNASPQAAAAVPSPQFPQPSARDIYTVGFRLKSIPGQFGPWDYALESAYQFGNFVDNRSGLNTPTQRLDQSAYMVVAQGGFTFADLWATPRLGLEYAFSSGDSDPFDDKHETFDNLFPTNHRFYGYMDFVSLENIHDLRASLTLKPTQRLGVVIEGHGFWLANTHDSFYNVGGVARGGTAPTPGTGYGVNPGYGNFVGTEIDIVATYTVTRFAQVEAGYGHFFVSDYIQQSLSAPAFGSQDANFVYAQVNLNF